MAESSSPFHAGERMLQERTGMRARLEEIAPRAIRDHMPDEHRELFAELPYLVIGGLDRTERVWASAVFGLPGFVSSPDARTLAVDGHLWFGDPLSGTLEVGAPLGVLGIQLETRRRNRMNGTVIRQDGERFDVRVRQSFGNCPQYIQARAPRFVSAPASVSEPRPVRHEGPELSPAARALVEAADTFFIASASATPRSGDAAEGVDVSHRGGKPGFVRVTREGSASVLEFPDFRGNFLFNTLGNLAVNPRAGLLFLDFTSGDVLSLTGEAQVVWDGAEVHDFKGAERVVRFRVAEGVHATGVVPFRWSRAEPARQLARTGEWPEHHR